MNKREHEGYEDESTAATIDFFERFVKETTDMRILQKEYHCVRNPTALAKVLNAECGIDSLIKEYEHIKSRQHNLF